MAEGELFLSTEMVEPGQRNDFWREITKPVFETWFLREDSAVPLEGSIRSRPIGSLLIGSTSFNRQHYSRNRRTIMQGGLDSYLVQTLVSGTLEGDFNGRRSSPDPATYAFWTWRSLSKAASKRVRGLRSLRHEVNSKRRLVGATFMAWC